MRASVALGALGIASLISSSAPASTIHSSSCAARWNESPSPTGQRQSELFGVATSRTTTWAVGLQGSDGVGDHPPLGSPLVERWNGLRWTIVRSPDVGRRSALLGVAIVGDEAWAVGYRGKRPLIERWDGKRWTIVPGAPVKEGILYAVAVRSARDVWAVGVRGTDVFEGTALVMRWDGRRWNLVDLPKGAGGLRAVTTVGERDVWVAGDDDVLSWNGVAWRRTDEARGYVGVSGIGGTSSKDMWAVGDRGILHWSGRGWRRARVDPEATGRRAAYEYLGTSFAGVAVRSARDAWAVGYAGAVKPEQTWPAIRRWDGRRWRRTVDLYDEGRSYDFFDLRSVSALTATEAWAVGDSGGNGDGSVPFIMRFACR